MNKKTVLLTAITAFTGAIVAAGGLTDGIFKRKAPRSVIQQSVATHGSIKSSIKPDISLLDASDDTPVTIVNGFPRSTSDECVIVDANGDQSGSYNVWIIEEYNDYDLGIIYRMKFNGNKYMNGAATESDDWFFVPVDVTSGDKLTATFETYAQLTSAHNISMHIGNAATPEAMGSAVWSENVNYKISAEKTAEFTAPSTGKCYIGIHANYPTANGYVYFRNLTVTKVAGTPQPSIEPGDEIFYMHPTQEEFNNCTLIDGNDDGAKIEWYYYAETEEKIFDWPIYYHNQYATADADEWLITPAINFPSIDNMYQVQINALSGVKEKAEAFEITLGTSPDPSAMTKVILDEPFVTNTAEQTFSSTFGIDKPGDYYIGIHIKSPLKSWRIILRDLRLTYTERSAYAPAAPTEVSATADATGALSADVTFEMPRMTVNGKTLASDEELTAKITSSVAETFVTGYPGETKSASITTADGNNTIDVSVSNAAGEGQAARTTARCGLDIPVDVVVSSSISDDNMTMNITWEPVTIGQNNGIVNTANLIYNVYQYQYSNTGYGGWTKIAAGLTECSYSFTATDTDQQIYEFLVTAQNDAGESEGDIPSLATGSLGKPYELTMSENFTGGNVNLSGYITDSFDEGYDAQWGFVTASRIVETAGDVGVLACISQSMNPVKGRLNMPKFTAIDHHNMQLSLTTYIDELTATTTVTIIASDGTKATLGKIEASSANAWVTYNFDIPEEFNNKPWAYVTLDASLPSAITYLMINKYDIRQLQEFDIALSDMTIGASIIGEPTTVNVNIRNLGYRTAEIPQLKGVLMDGTTKIADIAFDIPEGQLAINEEVSCHGTFTVNKSEYTGHIATLTVTADISDNDESNNSISRTLRLAPSPAPIVSDLDGSANEAGNGVLLTWSDPTKAQHVESFEYLEHGDYSTQLGDWMNFDFDGNITWTITDVDIPNMGLPKAFQVIDCDAVGIVGFEAHSGNNFLLALSAQEALTDDWLISPQLVAADGFSFYMHILSPEFQETIEILYSSTDTELDSFELLESHSKNDYGWTKYDIQLPADAKYVAIHYCSEDQFGIMIDDIQYTPANKKYELVGYNVYRNNSIIANKVTATDYEDIHADAYTSDYNVAVVAIKDGEEHEYPLSNTFNLKVSGIDTPEYDKPEVIGGVGEIHLRGFNSNEKVNIYNTAGQLTVATTISGESDNTISIEKGIYLVSIDGHCYKVSVK